MANKDVINVCALSCTCSLLWKWRDKRRGFIQWLLEILGSFRYLKLHLIAFAACDYTYASSISFLFDLICLNSHAWEFQLHCSINIYLSVEIQKGVIDVLTSGGSRGRPNRLPPFFRPIFVFLADFFIFGRGIEEFGFPASPFRRSWIRLC